MELKNNKSTWAALATLGLGAVAAGATAVVKIRQKRRRQREEAEKNEIDCQLTADQEMVYNEAVRAFLSLNERIYQLRDAHKELQPLIQWLATDGEKPKTVSADERINELADDIQKFLVTQLPFINACIGTISDDGTTFGDYIRAAVGQTFDPTLDVEQDGTEVRQGASIRFVLKLGYCFPQCRIASHPVKSIVLV